jgi:hypothetical protein
MEENVKDVIMRPKKTKSVNVSLLPNLSTFFFSSTFLFENLCLKSLHATIKLFKYRLKKQQRQKL